MSEPTQCAECGMWSPWHDPGDLRCLREQIDKERRKREEAEAALGWLERDVTAYLRGQTVRDLDEALDHARAIAGRKGGDRG